VPLPWLGEEPAYGFSTAASPWLPQPDAWKLLAVDRQEPDPGSTLNLYRAALRLRRKLGLGAGSLSWSVDHEHGDTVAFRNGDVLVMINMGEFETQLPGGSILAASHPEAGADGLLAPNHCVWLMLD
jgi:alpha-glucosidase